MFNHRQEMILSFIRNHSYVSVKQITSHLTGYISEQRSRITIIRDLKLMIDKGLICKSGEGRGTVYYISPHAQMFSELNVEEYFEKEQDDRQLICSEFNFNIWKNLHNLLSAEEISFLTELNNQYLEKTAKLSPKSLQKEYERLTIELAWKSSKIEGNTYTLLDTERLLKDNVAAEGKTRDETTMILNHKKALDFIFGNQDYFKHISLAKIEYLHCLLTQDLGVAKGIRHNMVGIVGTNYRPLDNVYQIAEAMETLVEVINNIKNPLEKALTAVLMISYIQPFEDGNKRTSRILGNAILLAHQYCPLSYRSVDEIEYKKAIILFYEQNNLSYFKKLFLEQFKLAVQKYF